MNKMMTRQRPLYHAEVRPLEEAATNHTAGRHLDVWRRPLLQELRGHVTSEAVKGSKDRRRLLLVDMASPQPQRSIP